MHLYLKLFLSAVTSLCFTFLRAQNALGLIEAERAFARLALDSGVRTAFLKNLDSSGVTFNEGSISNGIKQFSGARESGIKLLWHPAFAAVSLSGDLGFTSGPYEVRKSMETKVLSSGQYNTVWAKNKEGLWKVLVDMGTYYTGSLFNQYQEAESFTALVGASDSAAGYMELENDLNDRYIKKGKAAFTDDIREGSQFLLQDQYPLVTMEAIQQGISKIPESLCFEPVAGGISTTKDLAYMYGVVYNGDKKENYLRIWAHTVEGWILLLQVLKW